MSTEPGMGGATNFSNNQLTTKQIEGLIGLFEGNNPFDFWWENVGRKGVDNETRDNLRRNFPRKNYLREIILKLAWSIPTPQIEAAADLPESRQKEINERLQELLTRREWEGNKTFAAAITWWRAYTFVTGDCFVKLPSEVDRDAETLQYPIPFNALDVNSNDGNGSAGVGVGTDQTAVRSAGLLGGQTTISNNSPADVANAVPGQAQVGDNANEPAVEPIGPLLCFPERMPAQRTYIKMHPEIRKMIVGYRFQYYLGTGQYTEQGDMSQLVTEYIENDLWTITLPGKGPVIYKTHGLLCVAHMAWEEREDGPRGIPLALRLVDKILHIYSVMMDRRMGNKMGSVPMYAVLNATGNIPPIAAGSIWGLKTEVPWAKSEVLVLDSKFSDESLQREYRDARRELYHDAFLPFEEDKESGHIGEKSGKALQMLSLDQVKYRENYQEVETSFLQELCAKAITIEGLAIDEDEIAVKYDPLVMPDFTETLAKAEFFYDGGFEKEGLETMGVDEDEAIQMIEDRDEARAANVLAAPLVAGVPPVNGKAIALPPPTPGPAGGGGPMNNGKGKTIVDGNGNLVEPEDGAVQQ